MEKMTDEDLVRRLRGLGDAAINANNGNATFVSDMHFESAHRIEQQADRIASLLKEAEDLKQGISLRRERYNLAAGEVHNQQDEIADLKAENERLQALLDQDFKKATELWMKGAGATPDGGFQIELQATIIPLIAEHLAQTFKAMGGENYVTIEVNHEELGPLMLTMQRRWGEMPAAKAARLTQEIASLKAENDRLSAALANQYSASANLMVHHEALFQTWSNKASPETIARIEHARDVLLKASLATKELLGEQRARAALSPAEEEKAS